MKVKILHTGKKKHSLMASTCTTGVDPGFEMWGGGHWMRVDACKTFSVPHSLIKPVHNRMHLGTLDIMWNHDTYCKHEVVGNYNFEALRGHIN